MASSNFLAIYNLAPILTGHSLIISKRHVPSVLELDETEQSELLSFAASTTRVLMNAFRGEGFDWSVQDGKCAGQTIPHLHMHIVIRKPGDLDEAKEWHDEIIKNTQIILDSATREKLSDVDYRQMTEFLRSKVRDNRY